MDLKTISISLVAISFFILYMVGKFDIENLTEKNLKDSAKFQAEATRMEENYKAKLAEVALERKTIVKEVEVKKEVLEKKFDEKSMSSEYWRKLNDESRAYHVEKMRMMKEHVQDCFETFIKSADEYMAIGDYKNAAGFANACIKLKPEDGDAIRLKARIDSFRVVNKLGMAFVNIPKGEFKMGSLPGEKGHGADEDMHKVLITNNFYLMENEVTQEQWDAVMNSPKGEIREFSKVVTPSLEKGANLPVENVSFNDVNSFLAKINQMKIGFFRLPTEAEWEYAARANEKGAFGDYESPHATTWFYQNSTKKSQPVRTRFSNKFGLYDMLGNVSEWVSDYYAPYPGDPLVPKADPKVTENTGFRVFRGGSFKDSEAACRIANRNKAKDDFAIGYLGFRLVYQPQ